jgi:hypothetical protein
MMLMEFYRLGTRGINIALFHIKMLKRYLRTWKHCEYGVHFKRKKYKTVCAELAFAKVTFDRMVMIFFIELVMFSLFAMQLDYCNIQRVFDQYWTFSMQLFACSVYITMFQSCDYPHFICISFRQFDWHIYII